MSAHEAIGYDEGNNLKMTLSAACWAIDVYIEPREGKQISINGFTAIKSDTGKTFGTFPFGDGSIYTHGDRVCFKIGDAMSNTLLEKTEYDIVLSFNTHENGVCTANNLVFSLSVQTYTREEIEQGGGSGVIGPLEISNINLFPGKNMLYFSATIELKYLNDGTWSATAFVTNQTNGRVIQIPFDEIHVDYRKEDGYPVAILSFYVYADDIGYGLCDVSIQTVNKSGTNKIPAEGSYKGARMKFGFSDLYQGGKFKILAEEWNLLIRLLRNEITRRGGTPAAEETNKQPGDLFQASDINTAQQLFFQLSFLGVDEIPSSQEFPHLSRMTFGKKPDGGITAFDLLTKFESWLENAIFVDI